MKSSSFISLPDPHAKPTAVQGGLSLETYKSLCMQPETADKISAADLKQSRGGANVLWVWLREWAEQARPQHKKNPRENRANSSKFLFNDSKDEPSP